MSGLGTFGLNAVEAADDGLPLVAAPPGRLLLATNNGYIVRREAAGSWSNVYHDAVNLYEQGIQFIPNAPSTIYVSSFGSTPAVLLTTDQGDTWVASPTSDAGGTPSGYWGRSGTQGGKNVNTAILNDEAGVLYTASGQQIGVLPHNGAFVSTDYGQNWTLLIDWITFFGRANVDDVITSEFWVQDGYIWGINALVHPHANHFFRMRTDGTGYTILQQRFSDNPADDFTIFPEELDFETIVGGYGTRRLYGFPGLALGNVGGYTYSIDITDPLAPALTAKSVIGSGDRLIGLAVIDHDRAIAVTQPTSLADGAIYRTTDAGASWSLVLASTADLASPLFITSWAVAQDPVIADRLWVASVPPHVFGSTDGGATWTEEDYSGPGIGSATRWKSLTVAGPSPYPGLAHYPAAGAAATVGPPLP